MAISADTFGSGGFGGAVKDIFAGLAYGAAADGKRLEAGNYDAAAKFAGENATFTRTTTAVKEFQTNRNLQQAIGGAEADIAGAGFAQSGSALDILAGSMSQGALEKALVTQQGAITEEGYNVQQRAYTAMAASARIAADAADTAAIGSYISGGIKAITGFASFA